MAEEIGISGDPALRLGHVLGTRPELWIDLKSRYEIETAREALGDLLEGLRPIAG